jgi:putative colanic acid biosynthesis acetyltransferase WcaF
MELEMKRQETRLAQFDNRTYQSGRPRWFQALWFFLGAPIFQLKIIPFSGFRYALLRLFGAHLGEGLVIRPGVKVKYPWRLTVGNFSWLGEDCWIDNVADVFLGDNVCLSQGAYLCTGNHDWADRRFRLTAAPISVENGAWIGARAVLGPGVNVHVCGIVTLGSVAVRDVPSYEIYSGNPASFLRRRVFHHDPVHDLDVRELTSEIK